MQRRAGLMWVAALLVVVGCGSDDGDGTLPPAEGTLVYCAENKVTVLNPALTNTLTNLKILHTNVFDQLVAFGPAQKGLEPGLATSWTLAPDGKSLTFTLRQGVKWHSSENGFTPSRDFNADDVVDTFERYRNKSHPLHASPTSNNSTFGYWKFKKMDTIVDKIERVDDYAVKFLLKRSEAELLAILATAPFSIFSKEYADYVVKQGKPEWFDLQPVGTGPFRVKSLSEAGTLELEAVAAHFDGRAQVGKIVVKPILEAEARAKGVMESGCHIVADPQAGHFLAEKQAHPEHQYLSSGSKVINFLTINTTKITDKNVRQAISMALKREEYVEKVANGQARVVGSLVDQSLLPDSFTVPEVFTHQFDKARSLLEAAGAAGTEYTLVYMPIGRPYNPDGKALAMLQKRDLEAIGLKIRLATVGVKSGDTENTPVLMPEGEAAPEGVTPDHRAYIKYVRSGEYELGQLGDIPLSLAARIATSTR